MLYKRIFKRDTIKIYKSGHTIGLHSHTHPTQLEKLSVDAQRKEYLLNKNILEELLQAEIFSVAHPCGSYNENTLEILKELKIKIGFTGMNLSVSKSSMIV